MSEEYIDVSSIPELIEKSRVSSLKDRDPNYGKKSLFDGRVETCWCSDAGSPQWIKLVFRNPQKFNGVALSFQGGFAGKDCEVIFDAGEKSEFTFPFWPKDTCLFQCFDLPATVEAKEVAVKFKNSHDTYGRVFVYKLAFKMEL